MCVFVVVVVVVVVVVGGWVGGPIGLHLISVSLHLQLQHLIPPP